MDDNADVTAREALTQAEARAALEPNGVSEPDPLTTDLLLRAYELDRHDDVQLLTSLYAQLARGRPVWKRGFWSVRVRGERPCRIRRRTRRLGRRDGRSGRSWFPVALAGSRWRQLSVRFARRSVLRGLLRPRGRGRLSGGVRRLP